MNSTEDINLHEGGSGGEIAIVNRDFALTQQMYNQVYLALFGGNKAAVTTGNRQGTEPRLDWWANALFFEQTPAKQLNSFTEKALQDNALTAKGRNEILLAVQKDLEYLQSVAEVNVNVVILSTSKLNIAVGLKPPQNGTTKTVSFLWDSTKSEVVDSQVI